MTITIRLRAICLFLIMSVLTVNVYAEIGDYNVWQTIKNLISPPAADNKVTASQRLGDFPLLSNPANFSDGFSHGAYLEWQTVQLAPETDAICGNGSPYKFFVNRVANTTNTVIYMEGGGACWDYESCTGQTGVRGARNPNGIPDDYMSLLNPGASLVSPFVFRLHPWTRTKSQNWNMVYVPYCTGDTYAGDKVAVYNDQEGAQPPLVWHHNGARNVRAVIAWLKDNLPRPGQLLATGCSAGGVGSISNYYPMRRDMEPTKSYLINDSGPIYPAPKGSNPEDAPSLLLYNRIREAWGLDTAILKYIADNMPLFDLNDMGTLNRALATQFPNDRLGQTHFWEDLNFSSYSYERFFDYIANEPDAAKRDELIHEKWYKDTQALQNELANYSNYGYYNPQFRDVNESHCTSIIEFANADIQELGLELEDFVNNVMDGNGPVMQASESDPTADFNKPFNLLYSLLDELL